MRYFLLAFPLILLTCGTSEPPKPPLEVSGAGTVRVRIEGLQSETGTLWASLYLSEQGFPDDKKKAFQWRAAPARTSGIDFVFTEVPAGTFAISVLHDEDHNEELTTDFIGIPEEDYGFSNNPDSLFGPPSYEEAAVSLEPGATVDVVIQVD